MIIDLVNNAVTDIQDGNGQPYYSYGTWNDEANRLTELNKIISKQGTKFPLVFLLLDIEEEYSKENRSFTSELQLFIIDRTDINFTPQKRHESELPTLRTIESALLNSLKRNSIGFEDYTRIERFYPENKLNTPVNTIELSIPARYSEFCLT
jgi:hypothetical protein